MLHEWVADHGGITSSELKNNATPTAALRIFLPSTSSFAVARSTTSELVVTGTVNPDIKRNVPVISMTSRVVGIYAPLCVTRCKRASCYFAIEATMSREGLPIIESLWRVRP